MGWRPPTREPDKPNGSARRPGSPGFLEGPLPVVQGGSEAHFICSILVLSTIKSHHHVCLI